MARQANHGVAWLALLLAAAAQAQEAPKPLLPPGMATPAEQAAPVELPPTVLPAPPAEDETTDPAADAAPAEAAPELLVSLPASPELRRAGLLLPADGGYGEGLFARSNGRFLAGLMNRLDAPLASRWLQIIVTRALLSSADAPADVNAADWLAARARALTRLGAAADAHRLLLKIPPERFTRNLYQAAGDAALAAGDPVALCPLAATARSLSTAGMWALADGYCSAIAGDDLTSASLFDALRRRKLVNGFDIGLAERLASTAGEGRRASNPDWGEVGRLSAWRLGLASAAGLALPDALVAGASPQLAAWMVRLPGLPLARRVEMLPRAVATGAFSAVEANRLLAAQLPSLNPAAVEASAAGQLRVAWSAPDVGDRADAIAALLARAPDGSPERYGWLVAAGPAASTILPGTALRAQAPTLVAAMLAAGIVPRARLWASVTGEDPAVWALLAPHGASGDRFDSWAKTVPPHRAALLAAGLRGLGQSIGPAPEPLENGWTRALDAALAADDAGGVLILAATGMQLGWTQVAPDVLRRIVDALRRTGREAEARLIVSEAATRG
ncbi:hypothetical protein [Sandaracinobacteroides saxicola]|uniref:Uncharacterized protein n=1 Tax=Sandaracinobacteroides saxicola TaxID=2759707 RepID=A0A7G5IJD4_9SPHN|nr:hypothetical protein [Sandaracinobacteroides saxicola]QMW23476.1 hypothetical protein H3309_02945 [Sandaracinobacteroides saxicola]